MTGHDSAGAQATERSHYLAAMSAAVFADDAYQDYRHIPLQLPLKQSLQAKKTAMQATLAAYDKVLGYEVADFVTEASYRIGDVYASLSSDLMDSERPRGLSALELEQYELLLEEQADAAFQQAIAVNPSNLNAYNRLAALKRRAGEFAAAEALYLQALSIWPDHANSHLNLGVLYDIYMGRFEQAAVQYEAYQALQEEPNRRVAGWLADLKRRPPMLARSGNKS